ncbi:MAG: hypothetical protein M1828_006384 [Chrysothrix sp. TS-e1954]|nr:MAG: hypothetical protein M1828_006384 [Chrysothrix sp. TS-e1954]
MASRLLLLPLRNPNLKLGLSLGASMLAGGSLLQAHLRARPLLCDSVLGAGMSDYQSNAKVPVVRNGRLNSNAIGQLSAGSIAGLLGGVAVSVFSKPLAFLIGLLIFGVQALESRGLHVVPYNSLQKWFGNINLRSAVQDNVAFKLSFGATFALASFAEL